MPAFPPRVALRQRAPRVRQATADEMLAARARATECLGLVASALGRDAIAPSVPPYMEAALKVNITGYIS